MKKYISHMVAVVLILSLVTAANAQTIPSTSASGGGAADIDPATIVIPATSFGGVDLSMLTNHAALVSYAFKRVQFVQANVTCNAQADNSSNLRVYPYTNTVKSLDDIQSSILANEHWYLHVESTTDYFYLSVQLLDTNDIYGKQNTLFTGGNGSYPQQNQYGQWTLPSWGTVISMQLNSQIKISFPGIIMAGARLIARDQNGNPYPVDMPVDGDGFYFNTAFAGNGILVLSGWTPIPNQPNTYQWTQSAISLKDGSPVALTWVDAQVILTGSSDVATFKNQSDLSTLIYDWYGYGTVPMGQAVFTQPTTNVLLNTYSISGKYATSYNVEDQATHTVKTYTVPSGATSVTTGTNVMQGTYYIVPQGINLSPIGYGYPVIGKG
jgi:hypothetical protein